MRSQFLGLVILALVGLASGCAGQGDRPVVRAARGFLVDRLGVEQATASNVERISEPSATVPSWLVEFETDAGHRCVYVVWEGSSDDDEDAPDPRVMSVKSGAVCGDALLYDASQGIGPRTEADAGVARQAEDAAYKLCYALKPVTPSQAVAAAAVASRSSTILRAVKSGCQAANDDIAACVPPWYYVPGDPYLCVEGNGRFLKEP